MTPFQRQVILCELQRQQEDAEDKNGRGGKGSSRSGLKQMSGQPNAKSSRVQAIEDSQQEEEHYINKSMIDGDEE